MSADGDNKQEPEDGVEAAKRRLRSRADKFNEEPAKPILKPKKTAPKKKVKFVDVPVGEDDIVIEDADGRLHTGPLGGYDAFERQQEVHDSDARFRVIVAGRRGGKTVCGAYEFVRTMLANFDFHGWVVAPTYKMLLVAEDEVKRLLECVPWMIKKKSVKDKRITLENGGMIHFRSGDNPDALRGAGLDILWIDEGAFLKKEALEILRVCVSDKEGKIIVTTTPKGKNWLYDWYLRGKSGVAGYESFHWETRENPYFPEAEWTAVEQELPEAFFSQEYKAQFIDGQSGAFRGVEKIVRRNRQKLNARGPFSLGVDLAKHQDFTVLLVMADDGHVVEMVRFKDVEWPKQKARIDALAEKWKATVVIDSMGPGDVIYDQLLTSIGSTRVEGVKWSMESKAQMIRALQVAIEQQQITIPNNEVLIDELRWYEMVITRNGNVRYSAPEGLHDDCVTALTLANWGRTRLLNVAPPVIVEVDPNQYAKSQSGVDRFGLSLQQEKASVWRRSRLSDVIGRN